MLINIIDDNTVEIDGKRYIREKEYSVAIIKHPNCDREFCFDCGLQCPSSILEKHVIVSTMHGPSVGYCKRIEHLQSTQLLQRGAYLPLKYVLRLATDKEVMEAYTNNNELPF
jgi:hypothetical protein